MMLKLMMVNSDAWQCIKNTCGLSYLSYLEKKLFSDIITFYSRDEDSFFNRMDSS